MLKVLIAEDDPTIADAMKEVLIGRGYAVCGVARTVAEGIALGDEHKPDLAIIDLWLADYALGTELAVHLRAHQQTGVLFASGNISEVNLTSADGDAFIEKPYRIADLLLGLEIVASMKTSRSTPPSLSKGVTILHFKSPTR